LPVFHFNQLSKTGIYIKATCLSILFSTISAGIFSGKFPE